MCLHVPAKRDLGQVDLRRLVHEHAILAGYRLGGATRGQAGVSRPAAGTGHCCPGNRRYAPACRGQDEPCACCHLLQGHGSLPSYRCKDHFPLAVDENDGVTFRAPGMSVKVHYPKLDLFVTSFLERFGNLICGLLFAVCPLSRREWLCPCSSGCASSSAGGNEMTAFARQVTSLAR